MLPHGRMQYIILKKYSDAQKHVPPKGTPLRNSYKRFKTQHERMPMKLDRNAMHAAIAGLLNEQRLAILATVAETSPYCNLVSFTPSDDLGTILFSTPRSTSKYANMLRNPNVSLLVDDRMRNGFGFTSGMVVTAMGAVELPGPQEEDALKARHVARHADLKDFVYSPECALVQVRVARYILVSSLREAAVFEVTL